MTAPESTREPVLAEVLGALEQRRKQLLTTFITTAGAASLALALILSFVRWPPGGASTRLMWQLPSALALGAGLAALLAWGKAADFRKDFKQQVVARLLKATSPQLSYRQYGGMTCADFNDTGLFAEHANQFESEDYILGTIGNTEIVACEVRASRETRNSKGEKQEEDLFTGLLFKLDFNKNFSGYTLVAPDNTQFLLGGFAQTLQALNFTQRGELVKLEDPEFERYFCVYSTDQIEARYILSPSFMQRVTELRRKTDHELRLSFHHNHLYVALSQEETLLPLGSSMSRFEPRWLRSLMDPAHVEELRADLRFVSEIVEDLNLNTRIWTKS